VRPGTNVAKRQSLLDEWYRKELKAVLPELIAKWEKKTGVKVSEFGIKKMKTRWGTCNPEANLDQSRTCKKPRECLDYIAVHEMTRLLEPTHNRHFVALMNTFMPQWQHYLDLLNRLPVRHEDWWY